MLSFFSDLKSGKCSSIVEARFLRFWEARNVKRGGDLVDVNKSTVMCLTVMLMLWEFYGTNRIHYVDLYRVELVIADDTAEGAFGCFDGVMTKLHNLRAAEAGQMLFNSGKQAA
ncbi:hypothetical protein Bca52824_055069 [Brassica carinata]|uniref:Uncharacterized protein n=1 Tax=Brassica carinata TaxID=52824 RepID=A0A8X7R7D3_BRACI|nr:hypothetical protein Bca52824_055069 [Brassica carinata]